jgi:cytidylate kinase
MAIEYSMDERRKAMAVITVSRQEGSLGTEIAQNLAERLQYEYVGKDKIGKVLTGYGLPEPQLEKFDEKKPPFWDSWQIQRKKFLHFLEAVIFDFARKGNVVIVGRGGQVLLKDLPGVFHLRVTAPFEVRLKRILAVKGGDEKQIARLLRRSDRDSEGFIRSLFDADWDDPNLYDLVINTQKISAESAADMVLRAAQSQEIQDGEKRAEEKLSAMALTQKVEATLLGLMGVDGRHMNAQVEKGVVTLRGSVPSAKDRENCEKAVAALEGVKRVDNQILITEYYRFGS